MHSLTSIRIGIESLRGNPLRSVLSTLGIIMGVGSMVSVLSLGDGAEAFARDQIETTSSLQMVSVAPKTTDVIDGQRFGRRDTVQLRPQDALDLAFAIGTLGRAVLTISGPARFVEPVSGQLRAARITGVTNVATAAEQLEVIAGRLLTEEDLVATGNPVVIPQSMAEALSPGQPAITAIGADLDWDGIPGHVIGVLASTPAAASVGALMGYRAGQAVLARTSNPARPTMYLLAPTIEAVTPLKQRTEDWLASRFADRPDAFIVSTNGARVQQAQQAMTVFKVLMGALTSVSLVVGGVGVMNILLASVAERTREIGVRRAVGARQRDVLTQFLAESVAITGLGSLLGIVLGLIVATIATAVMRAQTAALVYPALTAETFIFAVIASLTVGLAFGTYPALRAARLSPTDAIRHE